MSISHKRHCKGVLQSSSGYSHASKSPSHYLTLQSPGTLAPHDFSLQSQTTALHSFHKATSHVSRSRHFIFLRSAATSSPFCPPGLPPWRWPNGSEGSFGSHLAPDPHQLW